MISLSSVWAVVLRNMSVYRRDLNMFLGIFYWPLLDVFIWGFLGSWIQSQSQSIEFQHYELIALMGILLWQLIGRGCNIIGLSLMEELWSNNIVNLFSLPLRISEWIIAVIFFYIIMIFATSLICMFAIFSLYNVNILDVVRSFLMFTPPLLFAGIWLGFTNLQIIISLGKRGIQLGFITGWFLLPFSGAYYPINVLPDWAQTVSKFLPMSYVFQGMRDYLTYHVNPLPALIKGGVLSIIYAACSIVIFIYCFNRSKRKGLAQLMD